MDILKKTERFFFDTLNKNWSDPFGLAKHVPLVIKWIKLCLEKYPKADKNVCLLWWWLHDIWHHPDYTHKVDHAIRWEDIARNFLQDNWVDKKTIQQVCHCVRAHRCKDMLPDTIEAKIIAFSDSASHMTDIMYLTMIENWLSDMVLEKLDRDYRDLNLLSEMKPQLENIYHSWKSLINDYKTFF